MIMKNLTILSILTGLLFCSLIFSQQTFNLKTMSMKKQIDGIWQPFNEPLDVEGTITFDTKNKMATLSNVTLGMFEVYSILSAHTNPTTMNCLSDKGLKCDIVLEYTENNKLYVLIKYNTFYILYFLK